MSRHRVGQPKLGRARMMKRESSAFDPTAGLSSNHYVAGSKRVGPRNVDSGSPIKQPPFLSSRSPTPRTNLRQIQELLGHKHLDSTQRYTRVNAHELRGAVKRL